MDQPPSDIEKEMNEIVAGVMLKISPGLYDAIKTLINDGQSPEMIQQYSLVRSPDITTVLLIQVRMTAEHLLTEKNS